MFLFLKELRHRVMHSWEFTAQQIMLVVLGLKGHPDQTEWLSHVNAGVLWQTIIHTVFILSAIRWTG